MNKPKPKLLNGHRNPPPPPQKPDDKTKLKELIKLCIELFNPDEAAERIAGFVVCDRQIKKDHADFEKKIQSIVNKMIDNKLNNL